MATITIRRSQLEEPRDVHAFIKIFGPDIYKKVNQEWANIYGRTTFANMTEEQISKLSEKEYEAMRDQIRADLAKIPPQDADLTAKVELNNFDPGFMGHSQLVRDYLGHEVYMQVIGLGNIPDSSIESLRTLNKNIPKYTKYKNTDE